MTNVIVSSKPWHVNMVRHLTDSCGGTWIHITEQADFTSKALAAINPDYIFIPHWSHLIGKEIYENYKCIIFHMTDLPYGRGGSPLQNLIARGHTHTKISAIECSDGIDTGAIYLKRPVQLHGTAREIFERSVVIIESMIYTIVTERITPAPQEGTPTLFRRRKKEQSDIAEAEDIRGLHNLIRMLDCEGYPRAYLSTDKWHIEFGEAILEGDALSSTVTIRET
jgi:methionyl-tRNA formyltransferase